MDKNTLVQRQSEAETKHIELLNQIKDLEAQIQPLVNEQVRVEGEHRVLTELVNNFVDTPPDTLSPSENETQPVEGELVA